MSNFETRIVADSVNPLGVRLTSFLWKYPRMVHEELMTHRVFSRNASSARAIPIKTLIQRVRENPAVPVYWGKNKPGMSADEELHPNVIQIAKDTWAQAAVSACDYAEKLANLGVHKQLANRPLHGFSHIQVIVTTTRVNNFFGRRAHEKAQPEIQWLAYSSLEDYRNSTPNHVPWGGWHLPFDGFDHPTYAGLHEMDPVEGKLLAAKIAAARCARTSYANFDGTMDMAKDLSLYEQLTGDKHPSPLEHPALADPNAPPSNFGPMSGWHQLRKMMPGEDGEDEDLNAIWARKPDWIELPEKFTCPICRESFTCSDKASVHANECPTRVI